MKFIYAKDTCALSVHILLEELKVPYEAVKVSLQDKTVLDSYNPKSYVPALVLDNGVVLTEAVVILQHLAVENDSHFLPKEPLARAKCLEMLSYISSEIHKGTAPLFYPGELPEAFLKVVKDKLALRLQYVEDLMADKAFLMGHDYTIADMYFIAILRILDHLKIDLSKFKEISGFKKNLESNPLIMGVLKTELEAKIETEVAEEGSTTIYYQETKSIHIERNQ